MNVIKSSGIRKIIAFFTEESNFRLFFLSTMLLASLCIVRDFFYIAAGIGIIWAFFLFLYRYIIKKGWSRIRHRRLILLFLAAMLAGCILHFQDNLFSNLYYFLWSGVCLIFFGGIYTGQSRRDVQSELFLLLSASLYMTTVIMIVGLVMLALFPQGFMYNGDAFVIYENRFVGIIFNANVTGFYALAGFLFSNILFAMHRSSGRLTKFRTTVYIICALINIISMFLSDSNDSLLMLMCYFGFVSFYLIFRGYTPGIANLIVRLIAFTLSSLLIIALMLSVRTLAQEGITSLMRMKNPDSHIATGVFIKDGQIEFTPDNTPLSDSVTSSEAKNQTESSSSSARSAASTLRPSTDFGHVNKNLDSGRFYIWKQSVELYLHHPYIGIGKANIVDYGKRYLGGLRYGDLHNGFITILVSCGLVGFAFFILYAVSCAKKLLRSLFRYRGKNRRDGRVLTYLTAFCTGYTFYSVFEVALLLDLSYRVLVFWLMLGAGMSYAMRYEEEALSTSNELSPLNRIIRRIVISC